MTKNKIFLPVKKWEIILIIGTVLVLLLGVLQVFGQGNLKPTRWFFPKNQESETSQTLDKKIQTEMYNLDFSYETSKNILKYTGTVRGSNSCSKIENTEFKEDSSQLEILLKNSAPDGVVCAQVITDLNVEGETKIQKPENFNFEDIQIALEIV